MGCPAFSEGREQGALGLVCCLWQGVDDEVIRYGGHHEVMATCHDGEVLPPFILIRHRGGLSAAGEDIAPDGFSGLEINSADLVIRCCCDKDEAACRDDWAAVIGGANLEGQVGG